MRKIIITPNEVAILLGCSDGYGRKVIREIKRELGAKKYITYQEFANYFDFTLHEVLEGVNKKSIV